MPNKIQRELAFLLTGKDVSATKTIRNVNREVQGLGKIAGKAGTNVARNVERGVVIGGAAAVGAIGYAINAAMDWETAFAGVRKTVEGDVTAIGQGIRDMATEIPVAATELANIAEAAGALGVAKEDILGFTEVVALLGVTTDLTTDAAATALGHLRTTLGLTGSDFTELGDVLVALGNNGASTESQILAMAESIAGAAGIVGASKEQVLAWASALASTGEEAEAGGSSIQRFWLESFKSVSKGGESLKLMAKVSGKTAAQFKQDFGKDATGALTTFLVGLGKLDKAAQLETLESLGFTDIRVQRALLKLTANTDNLTGSLETAQGAAGAMGTEAEKRFETTASKVQLLRNNVQEAAITIGEQLLPIMVDLAEEATGWLQEHRAEIKEFGEDLAGGIRDAVSWARSLDWDAIGAGLSTAADMARTLIGAFTSAPPWLQGFLITGFAANKFTGGAVGDVIGALASGLIKGVLGINAGVVNVSGGVVNGPGGVGGAAGRGGGLVSGLVRGAIPVVGGLALAGVARSGTDVPVISNIAEGIAEAIQPGVSTGWTTPELDKQSGEIVALTQRTIDENATNTALLQNALAGIDRGIAEIGTTEVSDALFGQQLADLEASKALLQQQLALLKSTDHSGYVTAQAAQTQVDEQRRQHDQTITSLAASERADATRTAETSRNLENVRAATSDVSSSVERSQVALAGKLSETTAAARASAAAIQAKRLSFELSVVNQNTVTVSERDIRTTQRTYSNYAKNTPV